MGEAGSVAVQNLNHTHMSVWFVATPLFENPGSCPDPCVCVFYTFLMNHVEQYGKYQKENHKNCNPNDDRNWENHIKKSTLSLWRYSIGTCRAQIEADQGMSVRNMLDQHE